MNQNFEESKLIKKAENQNDWIEAMMPTLALAKDYEPGRRNEGYPANEKEEWDLEPETEEMVRFSDCDPFGHLNNARYFDYFVNARDQQLFNAYKIDLALHSLKHQESWVVKEHRISYLKPARLKERLRIRTRLLAYTENETFVESLMLSHDFRSLKAFLWSRYTYVNIKTGRVAKHPEYVLKVLKATLIDAPANVAENFDLRLRRVLEEVRKKALGTVKK